ncbi:lytic polysaccharide monooxygenase [Cedecea davisae]|uniref:Lytic polysaccharide monooxygenase n=1 Tax=Cedecea davisae TaxID=158484 RepID=A0ABS6DGC9_9ENTR|nr:lytic polysaccharide monooxygenase [Cedecea davisae]MBU4682253.1 lytic polysaccharide monooxygenase [Cedecea davisae]MBU4687286.1 lytic polysaccharide monooxygenase [Cedecea davisae]
MRKTTVLTTCAGLALMAASSLSYAGQAKPFHGYVSNPPSRALLCSEKGDHLNKNCGAVQYEPQSLEAPKGFPEKGPVDGHIASAGHENYAELDEQTPTRWHHVSLANGKQDFTWTLTADHKTEKWRFFITKKDWDPSKKLTRAQFDLTNPICEQDGKGEIPGDVVTIKDCTIPADYKGYHVILGVWDIADTGNAFYQVIDTDIK